MDDSSKKGLKEINFEVLKEHILGSLQKRNLAQTSTKDWTFCIWNNYFSSVNKVKLLSENLREAVVKGSCNQD